MIKSILITGGTGSFGNEFVKTILSKFKNIKRLIIFSRDELKQHEMSKVFSEKKYKFLRYFLGDIRDKQRFSNNMVSLNENPLGVSALAGTSFNIDRNFTSKKLGFKNPTNNSIDTVSDRD